MCVLVIQSRHTSLVILPVIIRSSRYFLSIVLWIIWIQKHSCFHIIVFSLLLHISMHIQILPNNILSNNNNLLQLYSTLHRRGGGICSITTSVQHPPGWCGSSHIAPERPTHTSLLVERRQSDEANQCMGMIRRPWWSEANGCQAYTPTLFQRTSWDF